MTVRDLIEELEEMPMDLPIVIDFQEISMVAIRDKFYYLNKYATDYLVGPAVVLE